MPTPMQQSAEQQKRVRTEQSTHRRGFLRSAASLAMAAGLVGAYGYFASILGRFLYPPSASGRKGRLLVAPASELAAFGSLTYETPSGEKVVITQQAEGQFLGLSSVCPHLGCQVHWEPHRDRFFCPCHNGVFTPEGKAIEGPPAAAGQSLLQYPLHIEKGLLYIEVPVGRLAQGGSGRVLPRMDRTGGAGHDPCLRPRGERT